MIYHHAPEGTDAVVIVVDGYPDRGIVKYYNHQFSLEFLPANRQLGIDASHMLNSQKDIEDRVERDRFVHDYSYPLETAQRMADEINKAI